jgi:hypothetical protein
VGMIKKIISSKLTATATSETIIIGLKLLDAEGHLLKMFGTGLALVSGIILLLCWVNHTEAATPTHIPVPAKMATHNRRNRRSSASRSR